MKRFTTILIMLLVFSVALIGVSYKTNGVPITGTIGTTYNLSVPFASYIYGNVQIKNTGSGGNDLDFIVMGYAHPDATDGFSIAAGTLSDGELADVDIPWGCHYFKVTVSETVVSSASTVEINYTLKD